MIREKNYIILIIFNIKMFNTAGTSYRYSNWKILGGISLSDYDSHKTLFAGPDPADSNRILIRKLV